MWTDEQFPARLVAAFGLAVMAERHAGVLVGEASGVSRALRLRKQHIRLPQPDRPLCHIFLPLSISITAATTTTALAIPLPHWRLSLLRLRFLPTRHCIRIPAGKQAIAQSPNVSHDTLCQQASKRAEYLIITTAAIVRADLHLPPDHAVLLLPLRRSGICLA